MLKPQIVAGGGAPETYASTKLRGWAKSLEGREQLAAEKFADALESIPLCLSENAGMDPIDTLTVLRSKQQKGEKWTGIDVMKGKIGNMKSSDIIEPLAVKLQIVSAAAEAALMLPYTQNEVRSRHAILSLNNQSGGGFEIWQYTSRTPVMPEFEIALGDLGINVCKIRTYDVESTFKKFQKLGVNILTEFKNDVPPENTPES